jgi:hypothetical protein
MSSTPLFESLSNLPPISEAFTTASSSSSSDSDSSLDIELISQLRGSRAIRNEDIEAQEEKGTASFDAESLAQYHALVSKGAIESIGISPTAQEAEAAVEKYLQCYWESKTSHATLYGPEVDEKIVFEKDVVREVKDQSSPPIDPFVTVRNHDGFTETSETGQEDDEEETAEESRDQLGTLWDASSPLRSPFSSLPQYLGSADKVDGNFRGRNLQDSEVDDDESSPLPPSSPTHVRLFASSSESPTHNYEQENEEHRSRKPPSSKRAQIVSSRISANGGVRSLGPFETDVDDISSPLERVAHNLLHLLIDEGPVVGVGGGGSTVNDLDASDTFSGSSGEKSSSPPSLHAASCPGSSPFDSTTVKSSEGGKEMPTKTKELINSTSLAFDPVFESLRTPDARAEYSRLMRKGRLLDEAHSDPRPLQQTPL